MNNFTYSRIPSKLLITLTPVIIPRYYYLFVIPKSKKISSPRNEQLAQLFLPLLSFPFDAARLFFALLENRESRDEIKRERKKKRKEKKRKLSPLFRPGKCLVCGIRLMHSQSRRGLGADAGSGSAESQICS